MKFTRLAMSAAAVAALVVPAAALGHPSVYEDEAAVGVSLSPQTRYVVSNHGNSYVLRETNNLLDRGMIDYKVAPGAWRNQPHITTQDLFNQADTGAQPHHTCRTQGLETESAIVDWQERTAPDANPPNRPEPFYRYVPFQKTSAALDDDPAVWIPHVLTLTSVDLTQVSDDPATAMAQLRARCEALPGPDGSGQGVFVPADAVQTAATAFNSATILAATDPLNARITELNTLTQMLETQKAAAQKAAADAQAALTGAQADVARLNTRLRLEPVGNQSPARLAANGPSVNVSGPAGMTVKVRLRVTRAARKAIDWNSLVLGKQTATIEQDGNVLVEIPLNRQANVALRKAKANGVYFAARSGDRWTSTRNRGR